MNNLLRKVRNYEIQIRKAINSQMQGDFRSIFKGSGLEFDDVRPYQYGDDIRTIDWNVSAKGHGTFVKTFREEKEQTIYFLMDLSASQDIGDPGRQKSDIGKEICGVLAIAGARESSHIGLIGFTDKRELYLRPAKGMMQAYQIISRLEQHKPESRGTDLSAGLTFALNAIKRRSVIILITDFIDQGYERHLKALARRHDLVAIHLEDRRETSLPNLGIVPIEDKETGTIRWVNSSFGDFREKLTHGHRERRAAIQQLCRRHQVNFLTVPTDQDYVPLLLKLFKTRNRTQKR